MVNLETYTKVSVVIAVYNGEKNLKETIDSILTQTYKNLEIILVDDGSTDESVQIIESIKDPRITLIRSKNSGSPAAPRNIGVAKSTGDFIALCDQDDIWYLDKIEKQIDEYLSSKDKSSIGIIYSGADLLNEDGTVVGVKKVKNQGYVASDEAYTDLLKGNFITACSAMVPISVIKKIGKFDDNLIGVDDYDLWLRIANEYCILAIRESLCGWRQGDSALSADKTRQYLETEKIFEKLKDETIVIREGHGKNLFRIYLSYLIARDFVNAKKYIVITRNYPMSAKMMIINVMARASVKLTYFMVIVLKKFDWVNL